jgi:hypothetical protein
MIDTIKRSQVFDSILQLQFICLETCSVFSATCSSKTKSSYCLLFQGADVSLRCRWTDMLPVHYAAFFNSASVIRVLLKASGSKGKISFDEFFSIVLLSFLLLCTYTNWTTLDDFERRLLRLFSTHCKNKLAARTFVPSQYLKALAASWLLR